MSDQPIIIAGSGLAGYTLAREIRKRDKDVGLIMISRDHGGYYSKPMLSTALTNKKQPASLVMKTSRQMEDELGMRILANTTIESLDPGEKSISLKSGDHFSYRDLVLAVGADPIQPGVDGDAADALHSVNDLDDYIDFHGRLSGGRSVAILGAGLIGCEFANDLANHGIRVTLIDPQLWPLARLIPDTAGAFLRARLEAAGIAFRMGTTLNNLGRRPDQQFQLTLQDGTSLTVDCVLSAVGLRPRTSIAAQAGLIVDRGIVVDRLLATSVSGVYAIGDCAQVEGLFMPYVMPLMRQARALAATLCNEPTPLSYPAMPVTVKTPFCPTVICPAQPGVAGHWKTEQSEQGCETTFYDDGGRALGFAFLGDAASRWQQVAGKLPHWLN